MFRAHAFQKSLAQSPNLGLMLLQQTQARAHDLAGGAITSGLNLRVDEIGEMIAKRDGRVFGHAASLNINISYLLVSTTRCSVRFARTTGQAEA